MQFHKGGGGGGTSFPIWYHKLSVTGGSILSINIGAGGTLGTAGVTNSQNKTNGNDGGSGGSSYVTYNSINYCISVGGGGGGGGDIPTTTSNNEGIAASGGVNGARGVRDTTTNAAGGSLTMTLSNFKFSNFCNFDINFYLYGNGGYGGVGAQQSNNLRPGSGVAGNQGAVYVYLFY